MKDQDFDQTIGIRGDIVFTTYALVPDENGNPVIGADGKPVRAGKIGEDITMNVVLNQGKRFILECFGNPGMVAKAVSTIKIGSDVGGGSILNPEEASASYTEANQTVVYTTPAEEFFVTYPTSSSIRLLATINGANVMSNFPTQPNVIYTSAAIYTQDGSAVTYKRFPARTISSLISVDISWTITLV